MLLICKKIYVHKRNEQLWIKKIEEYANDFRNKIEQLAFPTIYQYPDSLMLRNLRQMAFDFAMSQLGRILPPAEEMKFRSPSGLESLVSAPLEPEDTLCERLNFGLHDEADVFRRGNKGTTMLG